MITSSKNNNFKKLTLKGGISLITLVITIVVIIILAMAVILSLNNNNVISNANKATVKNDISEAQNAYSIYIGDLIIEELDNVQGRGTIGKTTSDFTTITSEGVREKRDITLADIGIDSNNIEEIKVVDNVIVAIKWKEKYYNSNAQEIENEKYQELVQIDFENIIADALKNPSEYKHPDQSSTNGDIGIGTDGEPVNMDLWTYVVINGNEINLGTMLNASAGKPGYSNANIKVEVGEIIGKVPQYIKINGKDEFYTVTSLVSCFSECTSLVKAPEIPSSVTNMGGTFRGCTALEEVSEIPSSVENMDYTFRGCTALKEAPEIPSSVTSMGDTFYGCTALKEAPEIPSSVTSMGDTFYGCTSLEEAPKIPSSVTVMYSTFYGCTSLKEVPEIPSSMVSMAYAFYGCTALEEAPEIPSSVTGMSSTFLGCTALKEAPEIPSSVTDMGGTFEGCTSLVEAPEIPSSVTNMWGTFSGCTALVKAPEIPSSVTSMGATFLECTSLTGDIIINANPTSYKYCFKDTTLPIKLIKAGDATDTTLSNLAGTANNGNVTY